MAPHARDHGSEINVFWGGVTYKERDNSTALISDYDSHDGGICYAVGEKKR